MFATKVNLLLALLSCYAAYEARKLRVDPNEFSCVHSQRIDVETARFFDFLKHTHVLEKWFPWASRLREADSRILEVGKFYQAFYKVPAVGEKSVYFRVTNYTAPKILVLESSDGLLDQRLEIRTKCRGDRTLLRVRFSLLRTSALFQYTVGAVLRYVARDHLARSTKAAGEMCRAIEDEAIDRSIAWRTLIVNFD